jgi:hypothetical protein
MALAILIGLIYLGRRWCRAYNIAKMKALKIEIEQNVFNAALRGEEIDWTLYNYYVRKANDYIETNS